MTTKHGLRLRSRRPVPPHQPGCNGMLHRLLFEPLEDRRLLSLFGTLWNDLDGSGQRDSGEPGLSGQPVFLDVNWNRQLDTGEPTVVTAVDDPGTPEDESGRYEFTGLEPSVYLVSQVLPAEWSQTSPGLGSVIERVSVASDGTQANGSSGNPYSSPGFNGISADGRYVTFASGASNLVPGDTNGVTDVFVHDRQTDTVERVSLSASGLQADGGSTWPSISADGRFVVFTSQADNLTAGSSSPSSQIFVVDRQSGTIECVSRSSAGSLGDDASDFASISSDGRFVAFWSRAANLVPDDTNGANDAFVFDRSTDTIQRVSEAADGTQANSESGLPSISANGRFVTFSSNASNLTADDTHGVENIFIRDLQTGLNEKVPLPIGHDGWTNSRYPSISADGRYVVFESIQMTVIPGGPLGYSNVFVYDRNTAEIDCASLYYGAPNLFAYIYFWSPSISADGRYVAFSSNAAGIVDSAWNNWDDIFVVDRQTDAVRHVSLSASGSGGDYHSLSCGISADGRYVAFMSYAGNLVPGDSNGTCDVFVTRATAAPTADARAVFLGSGESVSGVDFGNWHSLDYGDAPSSYPVTLAQNGARHMKSGLYLGSRIDVEADGRPSAAADGDDLFNADDEEGVTPAGELWPGEWTSFTVTASAAGKLDAWIDLNQNGSWDDAGEQFLVSQAVNPGANTARLFVPISATPGMTFARFRLSSAGGLTTSGFAADGEVEDYPFEIQTPTGEIHGLAWHDVDRNGRRDPGEPLLAGWTVLLDTNGNGQLDPDERSTVTASDNPATPEDETGRYSFTQVPLGLYRVTEAPPAGWEATPPPDARVSSHIERVSVADDGVQGNDSSGRPSLSADGRFVAFSSTASNLVPGDTNSAEDVFVLDRTTDTIERVSVATDGVQGDRESWNAAMSADGRYVAFASMATNLVPGDTNDVIDVFVRDRTSGTTERVSLAADGSQATGNCGGGYGTPRMVGISADGRYVAFGSSSSPLAPGATAWGATYIHDRQLHTLDWAPYLGGFSMSGDGSTLAFNGGTIWDRATRTAEELGSNVTESALSFDGQYVAYATFTSGSSASDVFVHDRQRNLRQWLASGANYWSYGIAMSADGRCVAFSSGVYDCYTQTMEHVVMADDGTTGNGVAYNPSLSADGRFVAFASYADNLVPNDTNHRDDIFVAPHEVASTAVSLAVGLARGEVASDVDFGNCVEHRPSVTIERAETQNEYSNAYTLHFTAEFSEPVTGFTAEDVVIGGTAAYQYGTRAEVSGSGTTYNVAVTMLPYEGTISVAIRDMAAVDEHRDWSTASAETDNTVIIDRTRPVVTINQADGQADPTMQSPIHFTVVFDEPVLGFSSSDVRVTGTALNNWVGATTINISGDGPVYDVAISGMVRSGTVSAMIPWVTITDRAGNVNLDSTSTDNVVLYDATGPTADLADPLKENAIALATINTRRSIDVTFNDALGTGFDTNSVIDGAPEFTLSGDAAAGVTVDGAATLLAGSTYRYSFTGEFARGPVDVNFIAGSFADVFGNSNGAETERFYAGPTLWIADPPGLLEGNSSSKSMVFTVTLGGGGSGTVSVNYATANGSATAGSDYSTRSGTLSFPAGVTTRTFSVPVLGDLRVEGDETFLVNLSGAIGCTLADASATGTILEDDPSLSINDVTVTESTGTTIMANFTVRLSVPSPNWIGVHCMTVDGTAAAGVDYQAIGTMVSFNPNETSKTVSVTVEGDALDEPSETFFVKLYAAYNARIADDTAKCTILDNDATPKLSIAGAAVPEGSAGTTDANFLVTLSAVSGQDVTVKYYTANGTAVAPSNYETTKGTLTIPAGQSSGTVTVHVAADSLDEPDKSFYVRLSSPTKATLKTGATSAKGTILDDDLPPEVSIADASVTEGNSGSRSASFIVTLSAPSSKTITVRYTTNNSGSAVAGKDYYARSGTLTFYPGTTVKTIVVPVLGDRLIEGNETFLVNLYSPVNVTIADGTATGTILDNEIPPAPSTTNDAASLLAAAMVQRRKTAPRPLAPSTPAVDAAILQLTWNSESPKTPS